MRGLLQRVTFCISLSSGVFSAHHPKGWFALLRLWAPAAPSVVEGGSTVKCTLSYCSSVDSWLLDEECFQALCYLFRHPSAAAYEVPVAFFPAVGKQLHPKPMFPWRVVSSTAGLAWVSTPSSWWRSSSGRRSTWHGATSVLPDFLMEACVWHLQFGDRTEIV